MGTGDRHDEIGIGYLRGRAVSGGDNPYAQKIAELERQLSDLREKLDWTPISPDNLPTGKPHLLYFDRDGEDMYAIGYFNRLTRSWFINGVELFDRQNGYTHFCALSAPLAAPYGEDETK